MTAREDYKRHRDDAKANSKQTWVLHPTGSFMKAAWKDIRVGDIVKVRSTFYCMLLGCSWPILPEFTGITRGGVPC